MKHTVIFGGVGQKPQTDALERGVDVLIATPGRLLDLLSQGFIRLDTLEYFVLDEADRMLDMGFIHDIKRILPLLPKNAPVSVLLCNNATGNRASGRNDPP